MAIISLQDVNLNLGGKTLLNGADLHIEEGERVCLVGRNGAGKSSLMALLVGSLTPDSGIVSRAPGIVFGHMLQAVPVQWSGSVFGVTAAGMGEQGEALAAAHLIASGRENLLTDRPLRLARELLDSGEGWERHGEVLGVINQLGLDPEADFMTLSGGNKRRVALGRAVLASDHLLLDEPTNHLDIRTIGWLEEFLARRARTVVFISHDRAFARRLSTRLVELELGRLHSYQCGYDQFLERREARLEAEDRQARAFDKKLAQEEAWVRQGIKARRTRNEGRVRALEAMRLERRNRLARVGAVSMNVQEAERSGKLVIEAKNAGFVYPDGYRVFQDASLVIQRGDRVGLIGDNGTGKTTLLRMLLGELEPTEGSVRHGTRLEVSYFDQLRAGLNPEQSVMDNLAEGNDTVIVNGQQRHVAGYLRDFLFEPDRLRVPVSTLSGGERNRLLLARLFTQPSNVLVLDEPTNDLDVETLELLEELLDSYSGTVLMVSHDRQFLDNLVTSTLALEGDRLVREYVGGYTDWLRQRVTSAEKTAEPKRQDAQKSRTRTRRLSFKEQRELELLEAELRAIPEHLAGLEAEQADLEMSLADRDLFTTAHAAFKKAVARLEEVEDEQERQLLRWEEVEQRLGELR